MSFPKLGGHSEASSLETDNPVERGLKEAGKAVGQEIGKQAQETKQTFLDQLYGNVPSSEKAGPNISPDQIKGGDGASLQGEAHGLDQAANPADQGRLDEARQKLAAIERQSKSDYITKTFGEQDHIDAALGKTAEQKMIQHDEEDRQRAEQERQEEEEAEEAKKQQMNDSLQSLQSNSKGKGKGPDQLGAPLEVTKAQTSTERRNSSVG